MLVMTLLIMGVATFLIGLLPSYQEIGVAAPVLMLVLRVLQGIGLGGEWGGAVLMTYEYAEPSRARLSTRACRRSGSRSGFASRRASSPCSRIF